MAFTTIDIGTGPSGSDGDTLREAFAKVNAMLYELYEDSTIGLPPAGPAPSGYTIVFTGDPYTEGVNDTAVVLNVAGAEVAATWALSITSSGGGTTVSVNGTVSAASFAVAAQNLSGLSPGTLTASLVLSNASGAGTAATDTAALSNAGSPVVARYFGISALTVLNNAQMLALGTDAISSNAKTVTLNPVDQYVYFAYPNSLGALATIHINGNTTLNQLGSFLQTSQSVTPSGGVATTYRVYRSEFQLSGSISFAFS